MAETTERIAIVRAQDGKWFVRRVAYNVEDGVNGKMIYHCDRHISGPHDALADVPEVRELLAARSPEA